MKTFLETIKKLQTQANEAKACIGGEDTPIIQGASYDYVDNRISYIQSQLNNLYTRLSDHMDGHLPPIQGAGALQDALEALGLDDDYDVQKKIIYANDGTPDSFMVSLSPKKRK